MGSTRDTPTQLQPLPVTLSGLHLPPPLSALKRLSGTEVFLPESETIGSIPFKAIVSESTNRNLLLKSFYDINVRGKNLEGTQNVLTPLADQGIPRCAFTTTFGMMTGQAPLNDQTAPQFKVDGLTRVPFTLQGYSFSPKFLICDHIFCQQEYEKKFVAVLSLEFLLEYFIRAQSNGKGWRIHLPPHPPTTISDLIIYTDGCCLSNGLAAADPEAKPARGGYGIHFPTLPKGWDMYGALASSDSHTNQKAELTAVIRALQLVRQRRVHCATISIFTDSKYAVQGLNEWIPNLWRPNGYRTTKNREVINAHLFKRLDEEVALSENRGIPVTLSHVPREQNKKADALSRLGAASHVPSMDLSKPNKGNKKAAGFQAPGKKSSADGEGAKAEVNGKPGLLLGKNLFEETKPLVQWTPDGVYWAQWQSIGGSGEDFESGMEMLVV